MEFRKNSRCPGDSRNPGGSMKRIWKEFIRNSKERNEERKERKKEERKKGI